MSDMTAEKALVWRSRPPSGKFILHRLPKAVWCNRCGPVTKFHHCRETCKASGWQCLPGCSKADCSATDRRMTDE
jgi:hypothetical protein